MCTLVYMCVNVCVRVHRCMCVRARASSLVFFLSCHPPWGSLLQLGRVPSECQGSSCLCLLNNGVINLSPPSQSAFYMGSGHQTWVLILPEQVL